MALSDLLQGCSKTSEPCNKSGKYQQGCYKLLTTCSKQVVPTQFGNGLFADLLQVVRFLHV